MDASAYFAGIREQQAKLDKSFPTGFLHIISTRNLNAGSTAGTVSEVSTRIAAKHLCEATAEIASAEQVRHFLERGKAFSERMQAIAHTNHKRHDNTGTVHFVREK